MEKEVNLIYPEDNAEISLVSEVVERFTDNFRKFSSEDFFGKGVIAKEPVFSWEKIDGAKYEFSISENKDMSECYIYFTDKNELSVKPLLRHKRYFWKVKAIIKENEIFSPVFSFKTKDYPRIINIEGAGNVRDIGGISLKGGKKIRQEMIYRTSYLSDVTEKGKKRAIEELGVKTELDLRSPGEDGAGSGSPLGENINYVNIGGDFYMRIANDKGTLAKELKLFTESTNYPFMVHCKAGRDRTGMLMLFIEAILGADFKSIVYDYELSFLSRTACSDGSDYWQVMNQMLDTFDYINKQGGSDDFSENAVKFLLEHNVTKEDIAKIREILIVE